jgi:hypothetical protein
MLKSKILESQIILKSLVFISGSLAWPLYIGLTVLSKLKYYVHDSETVNFDRCGSRVLHRYKTNNVEKEP